MERDRKRAGVFEGWVGRIYLRICTRELASDSVVMFRLPSNFSGKRLHQHRLRQPLAPQARRHHRRYRTHAG
ncbi:MAG: hypothetical protein M0Q91_15000 [Methanoregula sp.]|nr:hypothetical protein [Methanoregula sp.]